MDFSRDITERDRPGGAYGAARRRFSRPPFAPRAGGDDRNRAGTRVLPVLLLTGGLAVVRCVMLGSNPEFYIKPDPSDQATNLFGSVEQGCGRCPNPTALPCAKDVPYPKQNANFKRNAPYDPNVYRSRACWG